MKNVGRCHSLQVYYFNYDICKTVRCIDYDRPCAITMSCLTPSKNMASAADGMLALARRRYLNPIFRWFGMNGCYCFCRCCTGDRLPGRCSRPIMLQPHHIRILSVWQYGFLGSFAIRVDYHWEQTDRQTDGRWSLSSGLYV